VRAAARADVVYATSMIRARAIGARGADAARREARLGRGFERATRSGRYAGTLDEFQATGAADALPARDAQRRR
jgi:hypothetical protein